MDGQVLDRRIGQRIRGRREELGLSLEDLAARSGVSRSMISKIERVESSPTAALLGKLCSGLGLTLSGLMADAERAPHAVMRRGEQVTWRDPETGYLRRIVSPAHSGSLEIVDIELPAGARVGFDAWKTQAYEQHVVVLDGTLSLTIAGERVELKPGDCVHMSVQSDNVFENRTKKVARYLVVIKRGN
ncbi:MAG TPA: XRE family transcriptional regulator [Candidatus Acidoferrales bacterium]|nr:XRE family transcriptional regulator [Candidatus Acidoferrales bacterium]